MTRYACSNPACPPRKPLTADAAPTCYTCGGAMAVATVVRANAATASWSFGDVHFKGVMDGPFFDYSGHDPSKATGERLDLLEKLLGPDRKSVV